MENKVNIQFGNSKTTFSLKSDTPPIDQLIKYIVDNKDNIDVNNIIVTCDDDDFDCEGFKNIIFNSISKFLKDIQLEKEKFEQQIEILNSKLSN